MEVQLEFNIENKSPEEMNLYYMQKQISQICDSMGKVRRKLFSEMGEVKKACCVLQQENEELRAILKELKYGKTPGTYGQDGPLFDFQKYQKTGSLCG